MTDLYTTLTPRLVVRNAREAQAFLVDALGATPGMVLEDPSGRVVHAELDVAGLRMSLTESDGSEARDPLELGGTPVVLMLMCDDPDEIVARAVQAGATTIHPVADRPYGMRDGRFRDPFGHEWMVTKTLRHLTEEELQASLD